MGFRVQGIGSKTAAYRDHGDAQLELKGSKVCTFQVGLPNYGPQYIVAALLCNSETKSRSSILKKLDAPHANIEYLLTLNITDGPQQIMFVIKEH